MSDYGEPWKIVDLDNHQWGLCCADELPVAGRMLAERSAECVNALAGIEDPAAFVEAVRELVTVAVGTRNYLLRGSSKFEHQIAGDIDAALAAPALAKVRDD